MPISSISVISRNTQGVKLIGMEKNEIVVSAANLAENEASESTLDDDLDSNMDLNTDM
jgi:DNA gyrase subunit A